MMGSGVEGTGDRKRKGRGRGGKGRKGRRKREGERWRKASGPLIFQNVVARLNIELDRYQK